ncbi:hypothetical protein ACWIUD_07135 [Helicobacter sp. 23-1044]
MSAFRHCETHEAKRVQRSNLFLDSAILCVFSVIARFAKGKSWQSTKIVIPTQMKQTQNLRNFNFNGGNYDCKDDL